jgi:hypothetical protein
MLFASPAPLHDLGSLELGGDPLHLQEQVVLRLRALSKRAIQEYDPDTPARRSSSMSKT